MEEVGYHMDEVPCSIKPLQLVCLEGESYTGCSVIDVTFAPGNGVKISSISFDNYFTASLTIKAKTTSHSRRNKFWTILSDYTLMNFPHHTNEAEDRHTIRLADHGSRADECYLALRIILRQPSPRWQTFSLKNLKFKNIKSEEAKEAAKPITDVIREFRSQNIDEETIVRLRDDIESIQSLDSVIKRLPKIYETSNFEVDGNYDINLLSYNCMDKLVQSERQILKYIEDLERTYETCKGVVWRISLNFERTHRDIEMKMIADTLDCLVENKEFIKLVAVALKNRV